MPLIGIKTYVSCPMPGARAAIPYLLIALALAGCVHTTSPVAVTQPRNDLDSLRYGPTYGMAPAPAPVVYAAALPPAPISYDSAYHLDAGDKLRVVVYGQ